MQRKTFIRCAALAGGAFLTRKMNESDPLASTKMNTGETKLAIGHGQFKYNPIQGWGILNAEKNPVNDCHEWAWDSKGRIMLLTNETRNNVIIYDKSGKLLGVWGHEYPGAHGFSISRENGEDFLFITDLNRHIVVKTSITGKVLMTFEYPRECKAYTKAEDFLPTETTVGPTGDIYITDGYGKQWIHQYTAKGEYIRSFGGPGNGVDQFDTAHGVTLDTRDPKRPSLLITSRNHNALKRFSLDGKYMSTILIPGAFVCRPVIHGKNVYAAVFRSVTNQNPESGFFVVLDENDKVVSAPGANEPIYSQGVLNPIHQVEKVFMHPHDVLVDDDENVYVAQWNSHKTYPLKLERAKA